MGIDEKALGLEMNRIPLDGIQGFLSDSTEATYEKGVRRSVA